MYHLASIFPWVRRFDRIPITRDQIMLLFVAVNEFFLGLEHYFAHLVTGSLVPHELIPIIFGPVACVLVIIFGIISLRYKTIASILVTIILAVGIFVGILGWYYHLIRTIIPSGPVEIHKFPQFIYLFVWAPPILGPLTSSLVGLLGIIAVWSEDPVDSGGFRLSAKYVFPFPISKTRIFFLLTALGILATLMSSVFDHARTDFENPWLWVPVVIGTFGVAVTVYLGFIERPIRADLVTFFIAMILLIAVGVTGSILHILMDLTSRNEIVAERFIKGAPFLAPLLFTDMGMLGIIVLLDPNEKLTK